MIVYKCFSVTNEDTIFQQVKEQIEKAGLSMIAHNDNEPLSSYLFVFANGSNDVETAVNQINDYCKPYHSVEFRIRVFVSIGDNDHKIIRRLISQVDEHPFNLSDVFSGYSRIDELVVTLNDSIINYNTHQLKN